MRMKNTVLRWIRHVEIISDQRTAKIIYKRRVNGKRDRGRPRLAFENAVSKILKDGHGGNSFGTQFHLATPLGIKREATKYINFSSVNFIYLRSLQSFLETITKYNMKFQ